MLKESDSSPPTFRDAFKGQVNTAHEQIYKNIRSNIRRTLPQAAKHPPNDYKVAFLCGGPSLATAKIPRGYKVATCNATHDWALDHKLKPSIFMMLDARPHNVRFVQRPIDTCHYFLCSQVDPSVTEALKDNQVWLFHGAAAPEKKILDRHYLKRWINVPGGGCIGTRGIGLLYTLGVRTIRIYGMDGCLVKGEHHAYKQGENDSEAIRTVKVGRRRFQTHAWMLSQADDFIQMAAILPEDLQLSIEGDGMISHLVNETARLGHPPTILVEK
jgi:hypothetical protein